MSLTLDLQSEEAIFFWTWDSMEKLVNPSSEWSSTSIFKQDEIASDKYAYDEDSVRFDTPESWGEESHTVDLKQEMDGIYHYRSDDYGVYHAVRADTPNHIILTGTWCGEPDEDGICTSTFILVLPKKAVSA